MVDTIYFENNLVHHDRKCSLLKDKETIFVNALPADAVQCFCISARTQIQSEKAAFDEILQGFKEKLSSGQVVDCNHVYELQELIQEKSWKASRVKEFESFLRELKDSNPASGFKSYYLGHFLFFGETRWRRSTYRSSVDPKNLSYSSRELECEEKSYDPLIVDTEGYVIPLKAPFPGVGSHSHNPRKDINPDLMRVSELFSLRLSQATSAFQGEQQAPSMESLFALLEGLKPGNDFTKAKEIFISKVKGVAWAPEKYATSILEALETGIMVASTLPSEERLFMLEFLSGSIRLPLYSPTLTAHIYSKDLIYEDRSRLIFKMPDYVGDYNFRRPDGKPQDNWSRSEGDFYTLGKVPQDLGKVLETFSVLAKAQTNPGCEIWKTASALEN